ncbi:F-actin-capping protein subunit alpha [Cokeromyces recurvatus]|uniref:F-actin-capping protein subunit alpha n=1 Tax=Cokeromyces recurvatus TaxID=90255 RepID=UPI00221E8943|nr:F-actin-capping protein subunit alpha [Cokeromyces recurvatus]KAI7898264.1 F-actin-capping protein subunit alpha [Cokeromyces recurvatus]
MNDEVNISFQDKVKISSGFVLCSPPGEVNDVFNDVRTLLNDDEALQDGVLQAIEQYNIEQYITVTPPDSDYKVIISQYGKLEEDRFLDPRSKQSFKFDHMRLVAYDVEEYTGQTELESLRAAVEKECLAYVGDHYPNGVCTIYANNNKDIIIAVVDNKYNPNNFWNGRWLATWIYDTQSNNLKGCTKINVHYYEDGNVQLNTEKNVDSQIPSNEVRFLNYRIFACVSLIY